MAAADVGVLVVRRRVVAAILDVVVLVHGHGRQLGGAHGLMVVSSGGTLGAGVGRHSLAGLPCITLFFRYEFQYFVGRCSVKYVDDGKESDAEDAMT